MWGMAGDLEVTRHDLGLGIRVAHLTDLHLDQVRITPERVRRALLDARVEAVVVTGDFFDRRYDPVTLTRWLKVLEERPSVCVLGNHDYRLSPPRLRDLVHILEARMPILRNEAARLGPLRVFGYDDPVTRRASRALPPPRTQLVLAHGPDLPVPLAALGAPLVCGHYHGGQVRILPPRLLARLVLAHEPLALRRGILAGWVDGRQAYISRGLGMSHFPVRFRSAPEIPVYE